VGGKKDRKGGKQTNYDRSDHDIESTENRKIMASRAGSGDSCGESKGASFRTLFEQGRKFLLGRNLANMLTR